jgi:CHASE2 domain-containing sensor protein
LTRRLPWRRLFQLFLATLFTFAMVSLEVESTGALDVYARALEPLENSEVAVVRINEEEYDTLFGGRSPLDAGVLGRVLHAVTEAGPRAVGVDLDTSDSTFRALALPAGAPTVVWATAVDACWPDYLPGVGRVGDRGFIGRRRCAAGEMVPRPALGGRAPAEASGVAVVARDPDAVMRRYARAVPTVGGDSAPTFAWRLAVASGLVDAKRLPPTGEELLIGYRRSPSRFSLSAGEVLRLWNADSTAFRAASPLKDRVVLLGGDYAAARDRHDTPLGTMPGVDVTAHVLETELGGGGLRPPPGLWVAAVAFAAGILMLVIYRVLHDRPALALGAAAVLVFVLAPLGSLAATRTTEMWIFFVPVLATVFVQQLNDAFKDIRDGGAARLFSRRAPAPTTPDGAAPRAGSRSGSSSVPPTAPTHPA